MSMANELEIVNVTLTPPQPRGKPNLETGESPRWIDIEISLKNNSDKTLFAMASVRQLQYDIALQVLQLGLYEPPAQPVEQPTRAVAVRLPVLVGVPAGETTSIKVSVPQIINFINPSIIVDRSPKITAVDISGLQRIQLTIAYDDKSFEAKPGDADQLLLRLASWGRTVQRTLDAAVPSLPPTKTK